MALSERDYLHRGVISFLPKNGRCPEVDRLRDRMGVDPGAFGAVEGISGSCWSWNVSPATEGDAVLLSVGARHGARDLEAGDVQSSLGDPPRSARYSSPYAAMSSGHDDIDIAIDPLGFRQMYGLVTRDFSAVSTSTRALSLLSDDVQLNHDAVALQSRLGWQLGNQTLIRGVEVLPASGRMTESGYASANRSAPETPRSNDPVRDAAHLLRALMDRYLDEHPDAELQLTGGLDSRIILAAIPPSRRSGLRAMTLRAPGSDDATIAAAISSRYGLRHEVKDLIDPDWLDPAGAFRMCRAAAHRIEAGADPIARAAVDLAEGPLGDTPRIEGLGGEVARGFYYLGSPGRSRITDRRIRQLAQWRLFSNEAVSTEIFVPDFARWAAESALRQVGSTLRSESETDWCEAVDGLYLHQRMRRWAGALASATCFERAKFNPMLDPGFLALVGDLTPSEKQNALFLARVLVELDPDLADIPLDGRPTPTMIASRSRSGRIVNAGGKVVKAARKVRARVTGSAPPPAGAEVLTALVLTHLRTHRGSIEGGAAGPFISAEWLSKFVDGEVAPSVATCAFLVNLLAFGCRAWQIS